jgi:hypothetical protein
VPDAAALSAVRERVLSEIKGSKPGWWFPRLVFASVALAMVGIGAWKLVPSPVREVKRAEPPRQIVTSPPVPLASAPQEERAKPVVRKPVRKTEEEEKPQVAIKLLTDDPNVIIYWLVDEKGE